MARNFCGAQIFVLTIFVVKFAKFSTHKNFWFVHVLNIVHSNTKLSANSVTLSNCVSKARAK